MAHQIHCMGTMEGEEMNTDEIKNAVIEDAKIFIEDHGFLTAFLYLDYGDSGQGFGGYPLYSKNQWDKGITTHNTCGHFIQRCLEIVGVNNWDSLKGKTLQRN